MEIDSLGLLIAGLTLLIAVLTFIVPLLKGLFLHIRDRSIKERNAIENIRLELSYLSGMPKYVQDIRIMRSSTLKNIPFKELNILLKKDINFKQLIEVSEVTRHKLCTYNLKNNHIVLIDKRKFNYREVKSTIVPFLLFLLYLFILIIMLMSTVGSFSSQAIAVKFTEEFSNLEKVMFFIFAFASMLFFELVWLFKKSPYDSYKELVKDGKNKSTLRNQGIIVA